MNVTTLLAVDVVRSRTAPNQVIAATAVQLVFATTAQQCVIGTMHVSFGADCCDGMWFIIRTNKFISRNEVISGATVENFHPRVPVQEVAATPAEQLIANEDRLCIELV